MQNSHLKKANCQFIFSNQHQTKVILSEALFRQIAANSPLQTVSAEGQKDSRYMLMLLEKFQGFFDCRLCVGSWLGDFAFCVQKNLAKCAA